MDKMNHEAVYRITPEQEVREKISKIIPESLIGNKNPRELLGWTDRIEHSILVEDPQPGWQDVMHQILLKEFPESIAKKQSTEGKQIQRYRVRPGDMPEGDMLGGGIVEEWIGNFPNPEKDKNFFEDLSAALEIARFMGLIKSFHLSTPEHETGEVYLEKILHSEK